MNIQRGAPERMKRNEVAIWFQAVRVFSFTASVTPVLLGGAVAFGSPGNLRWSNFPLFLVSAVLFHAATNLINDYYDFAKGVDQKDTFGSSGVLVGKLLSPQEVRRGAFFLFGLGFLLGLPLVFSRGIPILILGLIGILGGYFYTARPVGYKYLALGDLLVFILMGVLLVVGAFFAVTGKVTLNAVLTSLPIAALVTAILHANNLRDIRQDTKAGIKTLASCLGHKRSKMEYLSLIIFAYGTVFLMILTGRLPPLALLVFLSLPMAWKNIQKILISQPDNPQGIAMLDVATAKLHLLFGLLMVLAILLGKLLA